MDNIHDTASFENTRMYGIYVTRSMWLLQKQFSRYWR